MTQITVFNSDLRKNNAILTCIILTIILAPSITIGKNATKKLIEHKVVMMSGSAHCLIREKSFSLRFSYC